MGAQLSQTVRQPSRNIANNIITRLRVIGFTRSFYFMRPFIDILTLAVETVMLLLVLEASKVTRMTKSELIARLAEQNPSLYHRDLEQLVNTALQTHRHEKHNTTQSLDISRSRSEDVLAVFGC